jgi:hypothetical protein
MTNEELDKAVAEAQGWKLINDGLGLLWQKSDSDVDTIPCSRYSPSIYADQAMDLLKQMPDFEFNKYEDGEFCIGTDLMGYLECDTESSMRAICKAFLAHKKAEGVG